MEPPSQQHRFTAQRRLCPQRLLASTLLAALALVGGCRSTAGATSTNGLTYAQHVARQSQLMLDMGQLAFVDEGEGEVVVLLHGIPTSSWMYRHVIDGLVASGRRVIAPDLMGLGASGHPDKTVQLDVARQANYLAALLFDELHLEHWTHVVHDFGGPITWELMEDPRTSFDKLVILDTFAFDEGWSPDLNPITLMAARIGATPPFDSAFYELTLCGMLTNDSLATDSMLQGYCRPLVRGGGETYVHLYGQSNDLRHELPRYQRTLARLRGTDVRIVWGKDDPFLSPTKQVQQLAELLDVPPRHVQVLSGVGHLVAEEAPRKVIAAIVD